MSCNNGATLIITQRSLSAIVQDKDHLYTTTSFSIAYLTSYSLFLWRLIHPSFSCTCLIGRKRVFLVCCDQNLHSSPNANESTVEIHHADNNPNKIDTVSDKIKSLVPLIPCWTITHGWAGLIHHRFVFWRRVSGTFGFCSSRANILISMRIERDCKVKKGNSDKNSQWCIFIVRDL